MGELSIYHWLIVLLIVIILFGGRKIPQLMRGLGEGIHNFKEGVRGSGESTKRDQTSSKDQR
jgi:sec-independent protein translocase protein TatA